MWTEGMNAWWITTSLLGRMPTVQHGKHLPQKVQTVTLQVLYYNFWLCIGKVCSFFTPTRKRGWRASLAQKAPHQLPSLYQPSQTATHIRTKTLPHTEMENLTLYVILAAVFFCWNEWSRHRKFLWLQWTFCSSGEGCTFTFYLSSLAKDIKWV